MIAPDAWSPKAAHRHEAEIFPASHSASEAVLLAVDWGTTHRRAYALDAEGRILDRLADAEGIAAIADRDFPAAIESLRVHLGDLPVICAGMIGSDRGWVKTGYVPCPADLKVLVEHLHWIEPRCAIVPGVSYETETRADVMRGEEVQLLGACAAQLIPDSALACQPGTHSKWARIEAGRIGGFRTAMTGEIYGLLRSHSLLAPLMTQPVAPGEAFIAGVMRAQGRRLLGDLFAARAGTLLGSHDPETAGALVSGYLIGSEIGEQGLDPGEPVYLLADGALGALYAAALEARGIDAIAVSSEAAFVAGIHAIWKASQ